ncbi:hypothetical protein FACS1894142_5580 [Spirochaetia bacterium]|nr:hypothetical protein FACS1894142_5580 [Spirochaetia bacterium]GHU60299.1 hypothetical protein FACS189444_6950 [Spirochaetia bacterium]
MPQGKLMTLDEKVEIGLKTIELEKQGKIEEAERLTKTMPPFMAKLIKDHIGLDTLLSLGWNMAEVEAEYGPEYLSQ